MSAYRLSPSTKAEHDGRARPEGVRGNGYAGGSPGSPLPGRIGQAFSRAAAERRAALVVFVEAGDPSLEVTAELLPALAAAGADVIELGLPFSDPIADGPVIQRASQRALAAGTTVARAIDVVARLRAQGFAAPVVLFSYVNPILAFGEAEFAHRAAVAGVDGVLVTDLPPEEGSGLARTLGEVGVETVFLLAPTSTPARIKKAASMSRGFVYLVSRAGVTGERVELPPELPALVARVRHGNRGLPVAVGFGIATEDHVRKVAALADGVVVGSAVVRAIEEAPAAGDDPVAAAAALVRRLARATRRE